MEANFWLEMLAKNGPFVVAVAGYAAYQVKIGVPNQQKRESARENQIQALIDANATATREAMAKQLEREDRLIKSHSDAIKDQETRHYKDRAEDRAATRDMIDKFTDSIRENNTIARQGTALVFALAESLNVNKREMAQKADALSPKPIDKTLYETKGGV